MGQLFGRCQTLWHRYSAKYCLKIMVVGAQLPELQGYLLLKLDENYEVTGINVMCKIVHRPFILP